MLKTNIVYITASALKSEKNVRDQALKNSLDAEQHQNKIN